MVTLCVRLRALSVELAVALSALHHLSAVPCDERPHLRIVQANLVDLGA